MGLMNFMALIWINWCLSTLGRWLVRILGKRRAGWVARLMAGKYRKKNHFETLFDININMKESMLLCRYR